MILDGITREELVAAQAVTAKLPSLRQIGGLVRAARKRERMSQKSLAALVDVSHVSVIAVEKGTGRVTARQMWKILSGLGFV